MMEVDQPLNEAGLPKMSPTVESMECSESATEEVVQQNGTTMDNEDSLSLLNKVVSSVASVTAIATDDDSNEAKGLEDDDAMERLMYTDLDDGDDIDLQPDSAKEVPREETELVQNLSDTLIEDIIQLNKDSKRAVTETGVDPDRLESEESSDISPSSGQSSNQTAAEQADAEDTNGPVSMTGADTLSEVNENIATTVDAVSEEVADIDEESEDILLQEDNVELADDLDVDESLLLDEDLDMGEAESVIQIEDSVLVSAGETVLGTDGSVTIDESGLSILNTAAVDIADVTVDESVEASSVKVSDVVEASSELKLSDVVEDMVSSVTEIQECSEEQLEIPEEAPLSPDISDLIKFPDMDKIVSEPPESSDDAAKQNDVVPEVSDLIKFPDDSVVGTESAKLSSRSGTPDVSDLIKFDSVAEVVEERKEETVAAAAVVETTVEAPAEASAETNVEATAEASAETNVEATAEAAAETIVEATAEAAAETIVEAAAEATTEAVVEAIVEGSKTVAEETKALVESVKDAETPAETDNAEALPADKTDVDVKAKDDVLDKETEEKKAKDDGVDKVAEVENAKDDANNAKAEEKKEDEEKKETDGHPDEAESEEAATGLQTCRQALQAADEEDLLEMMEEPERMEADDEPEQEEDLDDNSSESGSTKQVEGDDEDDFEGSDYTGADEDESSRNAEDHEEAAGGEIQNEEEEHAEGEPPLKRKCSVDLREAQEEEESEQKEVKEQKVEEKSEEKVEKEVGEKVANKVQEKKQVEATKLDEVSEENAEPEEKPKEDGKEKGDVEMKENDSAEVVPSAAETHETKTDKKDVEETKDDSPLQAEQESEKMDISHEEPVEAKKAEETSVENEKAVDQEKKDEAEEVTEKEESKTSASVSAEKEIVKEDVKKDDKEPEDKAKPEEERAEAAVAETVKSVEDNKKPTEKEEKSSETAQDEVFLIDDDDDEIAESKKDDEKKAEKRPCPDDETGKKVDSDSVKRIRLSVEEKEGAKAEESKEESKAEAEKVQKEAEKSALDLIEPLKMTLEPKPVAPKEKKAIKLEFLEKFKKPLERMNRSNLEEFVLQKIVEGIAFKSAIAEMRTQLDAQDTLLQGYRQKVHDLNKQFRDLEMVHERVVKDLEKKNQHFITPVKITRAVGLQVSQPRFVPGCRPASSNATPIQVSPKAAVTRSPGSTPTAGSPNKNSPQSVQNRRPNFGRVPLANMAQKPAAQQPAATRPAPPTVTNKTTSSPQPSLLSKPTTVQGQITPINSTQQVQTILSASQSTPTTASGALPMTRKKPLQKYTPMRPPLSITQQVQQQQQTRQMQEQLMRQQIQDVQTSNTGGQSPLAQSPSGSPLTRTPEPASSPVGTPTPTNRLPTMVMKKVTPQPQAKPAPTNVVINRQIPSMVPAAAAQARSAPSTPTSTAAPASVDNSLIDLTDEDDGPKPAASPAAASATTTTTVIPKPPITILNGQQHQQQQPQQHQQQYTSQRQPGMPPLVVINQQRMMTRPALQQRPAGMVNGTPPRPVLMQRPAGATNGFPRTQTYRARMVNGQLGNTRNVIARPPIRQQPAVSFTHPAPLPQPGSQLLNPAWKQTPPRPSIRINNIETGIVISWTMDDLSEAHATIVSYQIYAYQETNAPPSMDMWRHVGDVKAMLLPMAVTLTQFQEGQRYHFAVRAVDEHQRVGQFSPPRTWNETTPAKA